MSAKQIKTGNNNQIRDRIKKCLNQASIHEAEANRLTISLADLIFAEKETKLQNAQKALKVIPFVLAYGANVTLQDMYGRNAYHEYAVVKDMDIIFCYTRIENKEDFQS